MLAGQETRLEPVLGPSKLAPPLGVHQIRDERIGTVKDLIDQSTNLVYQKVTGPIVGAEATKHRFHDGFHHNCLAILAELSG